MSGLLGVWLAYAASSSLDSLYERIIEDTESKQPIVVSIYIALCDIENQSVSVPKYPHLCRGREKRNLYWSTRGGLGRVLPAEGWRRVELHRSTQAHAVFAVWEKSLKTGEALRARGGPKRVKIRLLTRVYRGADIGHATLDFLSELEAQDTPAHVIGFLGHNYLMDVGQDWVPAPEPGSFKTTGTFVLACLSDSYFRAALERRNSAPLLLSTDFIYPNGSTVLGIIEGLVAGHEHDGVRRSAAKRHADHQRKPFDIILEKFAE